MATYRIVTEAVTNVVRHARRGPVLADASRPGATVVIDVVDDGVGIAAADAAGVGLAAMRERAAELGGTVHVLARPAARARASHVRLPAALP